MKMALTVDCSRITSAVYNSLQFILIFLTIYWTPHLLNKLYSYMRQNRDPIMRQAILGGLGILVSWCFFLKRPLCTAHERFCIIGYRISAGIESTTSCEVIAAVQSHRVHYYDCYGGQTTQAVSSIHTQLSGLFFLPLHTSQLPPLFSIVLNII